MDKWEIRRVLRNDLRDAILFLAGLAGVIHETIYVVEPREPLLILFAAMMGLPAFLRWEDAEDKRKKRNGEAPP